MKPSRSPQADPIDLARRAIGGDLRAVARLLTAIEDDADGVDVALDAIYRRAGRAHVVGITGVAGAGKSTLVDGLIRALRGAGQRVGVIAIDPSSALSGGAILGDRVRMGDFATDPGVFVRSMATRGHRGALARVTPEAIEVLDAAGFDVILVETVGAGQDEFEIADAALTTVVVSAPGLGDGVQAVKAGILEMADIHVVNKSDRPEANHTLADLHALVHMVTRRRDRDWIPPVLATSALTGAGIAELVVALRQHREQLLASGEWERRRQAACAARVWAAVEGIAVRQVRTRTEPGALAATLADVNSRARSPRAAARALVGSVWP